MRYYTFRIRHIHTLMSYVILLLIILAACGAVSWGMPIAALFGTVFVKLSVVGICDKIIILARDNRIRNRYWMVGFYRWWIIQRVTLKNELHPLVESPLYIFLQHNMLPAFELNGVMGMEDALRDWLLERQIAGY